MFKLASTNIQAWEPDHEKLPQTLEQAIEHLRTDRTEDDILYELLLKLGLDLASRIVTRDFIGKQVHAVGEGVLLACLATNIHSHEVEELAQGSWRGTASSTLQARVRSCSGTAPSRTTSLRQPFGHHAAARPQERSEHLGGVSVKLHFETRSRLSAQGY